MQRSPVDRMKMMGVLALVSPNTSSSVHSAGSVNLEPNRAAAYRVHANKSFSSRSARTISRRQKEVGGSAASQLPGSG